MNPSIIFVREIIVLSVTKYIAVINSIKSMDVAINQFSSDIF